MLVEVDVAGFRAFERAGWEAAGKAARYAAAWGPITSQSVPISDLERESRLSHPADTGQRQQSERR